MRLWQHFASLLWIGEYAPVPVIYRRFFFAREKFAREKLPREKLAIASLPRRPALNLPNQCLPAGC